MRKGVDPVNAIAVIYVNDHLESLRAEARQRRTASRAPGAAPAIASRRAPGSSAGRSASKPADPHSRRFKLPFEG